MYGTPEKGGYCPVGWVPVECHLGPEKCHFSDCKVRDYFEHILMIPPTFKYTILNLFVPLSDFPCPVFLHWEAQVRRQTHGSGLWDRKQALITRAQEQVQENLLGAWSLTHRTRCGASISSWQELVDMLLKLWPTAQNGVRCAEKVLKVVLWAMLPPFLFFSRWVEQQRWRGTD